MVVAPQPEQVRQFVVRGFADFGAPATSESEVKETILIDQGKCLARSYRLNGLMAMWLLETGVLQFYDPEGAMLRTVNLLEELAGQREAA